MLRAWYLTCRLWRYHRSVGSLQNRKSWGRPGFMTFSYFLVALFPVLGLLNHYFLPLFVCWGSFSVSGQYGTVALVASALVTGLDRFPKKQWRLQTAICGTLLLILGILTWRQPPIYRNPETSGAPPLRKIPILGWRKAILAASYCKKNELDEAIPLFKKAVEIGRTNVETQYNLGNALLQKGLMEEAAIHFQKVLELWPATLKRATIWAVILLQKGQLDEAIVHFQKVLDEKPDDARAHNNLQRSEQKGQIDEAILHYRKTLEYHSIMAGPITI